MITIAWAYGYSSVIVKLILGLLLTSDIDSNCFLAPPWKIIVGCPDGKLLTSKSLQKTPFLKPVPKALEAASLAAYLLA